MSGYHLSRYFWDLLDWFLANHFLPALFAKLYYGQRLFLCSWAIVTGERFITKWWHSVKYPGAWASVSTTSWRWDGWVHLTQQPLTDVNLKICQGRNSSPCSDILRHLGRSADEKPIPLKPQEGWWLRKNFSRDRVGRLSNDLVTLPGLDCSCCFSRGSSKAQSTAAGNQGTNPWGSGVRSLLPGLPADLPYDQNVPIRIPVPCFLL